MLIDKNSVEGEQSTSTSDTINIVWLKLYSKPQLKCIWGELSHIAITMSLLTSNLKGEASRWSKLQIWLSPKSDQQKPC